MASMMRYLRRPSMKGRDSSGNEISLLNCVQSTTQRYQPQPYINTFGVGAPGAPIMARNNSNMSIESNASPPSLLRSDSYDSQGTNETRSPITPTFPSSHRRDYSQSHSQYRNEYSPYYEYRDIRSPMKDYESSRPSPPYLTQKYCDESMYSDDPYNGQSERSAAGKRYPCRFKDTHACDKSFTTSGHASRHSKIHTAEKGVPCSFPGCTKKFTRADNMKQHLDTHFKDKPRSSSSASNGNMKLNRKSPLTVAAGVHKKSSPRIRNRSPGSCTPLRTMARSNTRSDIPPFDINAQTHAQYPVNSRRYSAIPSPISTYDALDMGSFRQSLPTKNRGLGAGSLDILAHAAGIN